MEFLDLPLLVLEEILSHIPYDDHSTLSRLCLVSRALYHLATPRLYHTLTVITEGGKVANPEMLKSPHWRYWTRKVTVVDSEAEAAPVAPAEGRELDPEGDAAEEEMVSNDWKEVAEVVGDMQARILRDFKFISRKCPHPIPAQSALSAALSKHILRTLKLTMYSHPTKLTTDPILASLTPTQCATLTKLSINHINPDNEAELVAMYKALKHTNLTEISLKSRAFTDLEFWVPLPELQDTPSRLSSIKLYGFDIPSPADCIGTFFNPDRLNKLVLWECRGYHTLLARLSRAPQALTALRELSLYAWEDVDDVAGVIAFIGACTRLRSVLLNLSSFTVPHMKALIKALESSRECLDTLTVQVREPVSTRAMYYRPAWLRSLSKFTKLEGLGMNYEMKGLKLSNITPTLPENLRTLEIRLRGELLTKDKTKSKVRSQTRGIARERAQLREVMVSDGDYFDVSFCMRVAREEQVYVVVD